MSQNPAKFKLLGLPSIALEHVIRTMDLKTMFLFSLASRKAKSILNYSLPKVYFHVCVYFSFWGNNAIVLNQQFTIETNLDISEEARSYMIQGILYKVVISDGEVHMKWDESFQVGMETLMTHFAESFHLPKTAIEFGSGMNEAAALPLLNHAKSLNCPLTEIEMRLQDLPIEVYRAFLDVGPRIIQKLHLESRSALDFQYRPSEVFKLDELEIGDGHWVHLEDFMECKHVVVRNMTDHPNMYHADSKKLNDFFKLWKASNCKLEHLEFEVSYTRDLSFDEIIAELDGTNYLRIVDNQKVEIQRVDGIKARIIMNSTHFFMDVFD